jgi:hypothetical protein
MNTCADRNDLAKTRIEIDRMASAARMLIDYLTSTLPWNKRLRPRTTILRLQGAKIDVHVR